VRRGEEVNHDGGEVSGLDNCLRVESVGAGQENEDGMCWSTCRLCKSVSSCAQSRFRVPGKTFARSSLGDSRFGVDKPSISAISVSLTIPVHLCNEGDILGLSQVSNTK
jgi:hypothetical protein